MPLNSLDDVHRRFLVEICETSDGNPQAQLTTPSIGKHIGIDKEAARQTAEYLIGYGYVEVRTLSGGIGITEEGIRQAVKWGARLSSDSEKFQLNPDPVVNQTGRQGVEETTGRIKETVGQLGLAYDKLNELMADLKTIEAQMASPFPKTGIIRETFLSIRAVLDDTQDKACADQIDALLGL